MTVAVSSAERQQYFHFIPVLTPFLSGLLEHNDLGGTLAVFTYNCQSFGSVAHPAQERIGSRVRAQGVPWPGHYGVRSVWWMWVHGRKN